jgi:hypothetical protein
MNPNRFVRTKVLPLLLLLTFVLVFPTSAMAWGDKAHQIIAALTWLRLTDATKREIMVLLPEGKSDPNGPLAAVASWAERQEAVNPVERRWDYVDIPFEAERYDQKRDCADGNCIVVKLEEKKNILQSSNNRQARAVALKYVVHLVGDIHQPLHCTDRNDKAGNAVYVKFLGQTSNLHKVWDSDMVEASQLSVGEYAKKLARVPVLHGYWISDWANDSHAIAKRYVYTIPQDRELGTDYYRRNLPILERQLAQAAEKLVEILEDTLKSRPATRSRNKQD